VNEIVASQTKPFLRRIRK